MAMSEYICGGKLEIRKTLVYINWFFFIVVSIITSVW